MIAETMMTRDTEVEPLSLPDHTQLPETDDSIVQNFQEHPQSMLLTDTIEGVLQHLHPDRQYAIGQDCGVYWNLEAALSDDPVRGAIAPDWFYVPGVPPMLNTKIRRSYVLWKEQISPFIVIEFASGDGSEERDQTPYKGKFWIYERMIRAQYYAIYEVEKASVALYRLVNGRYAAVSANERGHYPLPQLGVELGIWSGWYGNMQLPWLRWWDAQGNLLLTGDERAAQERQGKEQAQQEAEQERQGKEQAQQEAEQERQGKEQAQQQAAQERQGKEQAQQQAAQERREKERLLALLRSLGVDPDQAGSGGNGG